MGAGRPRLPERFRWARRVGRCRFQTGPSSSPPAPPPQTPAGTPSPGAARGAQGLTFMRSYLSSTSCSQEMNWRALKRSRTDLFSSP